MKRLLGKLTYSNVVSSLCLVLVLGGGTAFAAAKLAKNSVGTPQLKSGAVTGGKIAAGAVNGEKIENDSITGADIKNSTLGTVPTADVARTATTAQSAQTAQSAKTAESATTAQSAESANTAQSAVSAERANTAATASSAQSAGSAISAQTAKSAESAAKATSAENLAGHTAFTFFLAEGERQVATAYPLNVIVRCALVGEDRTASMIVEAQEESTLLVTGKAFQSISGQVTVLSAEGKADAKAAKAGTDLTAVGPNGAALAIQSPTVGTDLDGNHKGQCFFSGAVEELKALPAQ